ncbi:MAG: DUF1501 domain-containing protein [Verrucomicrobiales bacterium]|nr:DUF1501 domain-containing protein [Verrucomicrobiales bacterium]
MPVRRSDGFPCSLVRREFLRRCGLGLGGLALGELATTGTQAAPADGVGTAPLAPRTPPLPPKVRRVVHFFLNGGPSHLDTFDPKPILERYAGKPLPTGHLPTERKTGGAFPSPFKFRRYGRSGMEVSELFARTAEHADSLAVIRSMQANLPNHEPSLLLMNCGDSIQSRPSVGSWISYGLGSENQNLPGFIVLCPHGLPVKEHENWQSGFLPAVYQGTFIDSSVSDPDRLIENIRSPAASLGQQRRQLALLKRWNEAHREARGGDSQLEARIQSFELAYRMQMEATDAFDLGREPTALRELYGRTVHGNQTLIARRLLERGVRYVQLWHGAGQPWDSHTQLEAEHRKLSAEIDQPIAALLTDLKSRGMFEDTLVIWGGEFGRTPTTEGSNGRDHNPYGFTMWLAGGGIRGGHIHGATDEFGFQAVDGKVHVHDLHATLLHLLGFDHERFTYRYAGRDFRLTDVHGRVVTEVLS